MSRLLEWQDEDGITHQWAMPLALLQGDASDVRRELAKLGLSISPNRTARDLLASYLQVFPVEARARCVDKLSWHGDVFVTGLQTCAKPSTLWPFLCMRVKGYRGAADRLQSFYRFFNLYYN